MHRSDFIEAVTHKIEDLRKCSFDELSVLNPQGGEKIEIGKSHLTLSIYKDLPDSDRIRIVVQGYRNFFLGIGQMHAEGFIINKKGEITELTRPELYDFE